MQVVHTIDKVRKYINAARGDGKKIGFVPTMGYLHEGHLSLVDISKQHSDYQVMSIFVNRIQFNDKKDFDSYPVDLQRDFALAEKQGIDLMFAPSDSEMYHNSLAFVDVELLTDNLCGAYRPGHFRGVFTVVSKLFNIVQPDVSVFGQKDIQQALSINKIVNDLNFPMTIIIAPIIREQDGLAMSSRNKNLDPKSRTRALALNRGLHEAEKLLLQGERNSRAIIAVIENIVNESGPDKIDYISIVHYDDLSHCETISGKGVIALAVFYNGVRLIDNMIVSIEDGKVQCVY